MHSGMWVCNASEVRCSCSRCAPPIELLHFYQQEMIDEADRNGDGVIDEDEFYRIMKKTSLF
jgi:hypothetical protein